MNFSRYFLFNLLLFSLVAWPLLGLCLDDDKFSDEPVPEEVTPKEDVVEDEASTEEAVDFPFSFDDVFNKLVIVSCEGPEGQSAGSGFIATVNGKTYIFTNQHVVMGSDRVSFTTAAGKQLHPRNVQLSTTRDIARLLLPEGTEGFSLGKEFSIDEPVAVFGNSEGADVATELYGKILSVGSDVLEVSAEFVPGNSGSPVLTTNQEVVGIATFIRYSVKKKTDAEEESDEEADADEDEDRGQTRRFCYRLDKGNWKSVHWKKYNDKYGKSYLQNKERVESIFSVIESWCDDPFGRIAQREVPDSELEDWIVEHNHMINRITRLNDKGRASAHELENTNKRIRQSLEDSAQTLSAVCHKRARQMKSLAGQKELTGFLRKEFEDFAEEFETMAYFIDKFYREKLSTINYFHFKNEPYSH